MGRQNILFIGTAAHGLKGLGKQASFIHIASPILLAAGYTVSTATTAAEVAASIAASRPAAACMIYNEEHFAYFDEVAGLQAMAEEAGAVIVHPVGFAPTIANKRLALEFFGKAGVDVPRTVDRADDAVFSNVMIGSHRRVAIVPAGGAVDPLRHNTEFIDTVHRYRGEAFHTSLRAMVFGETCVAIYLRCRPVSDGDPSVHAGAQAGPTFARPGSNTMRCRSGGACDRCKASRW